MSQSRTDILIVGAGPTGLMLACQLSLHPNISFRIIDKNPGRTTESRALFIHSRSLELFDQLGIIDRVLSASRMTNAMNVFFNGRRWLRIEFDRVYRDIAPSITHYPFILLIDQSITEQILESFLNERNIKVERESEIIDFVTVSSNDEVEATLANGEIIRAKYVCACDGAHSFVRRKLAVPFVGSTYSQSIFIVDCKVNNLTMEKDDISFFFAYEGLAGIFPLPNDRYRLVGSIPEQNSASLTFTDTSNIFKNRSKNFNVILHDYEWISTYRSHHRHVTSFRHENRIFLLGDAAHIHSPVGGQGMNAGLQDAHNLGWKLAFVLKHSGKDHLLETYHNERLPTAQRLIKGTDYGFILFWISGWFLRFFRFYIMPFILRFVVQPLYNYSRKVRQRLFLELSQLGITYRSSIMKNYDASAGQFHSKTPVPGDRFPIKIFDPCHYHLLILNKENSVKMNLFVEWIKTKYAAVICIHDNQLDDIPFPKEGALLIRPDGYIAYRTTTFDIEHFEVYFAHFF